MSKTKQKIKNIPELRFSGFGDEWKKEELKEMVISHNSGIYKKKAMYGEGVNIIGVSNLYDINSIDGQIFRKVPLSREELKEYTLEEGDLLYGESSLVHEGIAKTLYTTKKGEGTAFAWHTRRYKVDTAKISSRYLYYFLNASGARKFFMSVATQTALTGITTKDYFLVPVNIPPLPEQQKIAKFLGSVDEWIENLKKQKEKLEEYKKGMMQKIFSQEIRFKDDNGKKFPDWEEKKLNKIGKTFNGLTGKTKNDFGLGEKFITYKQIFDNSRIDLEKCALVKVDKGEEQNKAKFGDIFFTTSSETPLEVGFSSVLLDKNENPYLNSFAFGFRPNSLEELNPHFARFFFRSPLFRREVVRLAQGSTRYNISKIAFMKINILLPSEQEQQKIAEFLTSVDNLIELKQKQISAAEQWKKGLMQKMFV